MVGEISTLPGLLPPNFATFSHVSGVATPNDDTGEQARSVYLLGTWDLSRGGVNGATRWLTVNIHRWVAKLAVVGSSLTVLGACRKTGVSPWDTWDR